MKQVQYVQLIILSQQISLRGMQQLLDDPETINFYESNQVHLTILKMEIDRRVDKIKLMINGGGQSNQNVGKRKIYVDAELQTQDYNTDNNKENFNVTLKPKRNYEKKRYMSTYNSNIFVKNEQQECKSRPSLPSDNLNRQSFQAGNNNYNAKTKVSDYLSSKKASLINYGRFQNSSIRNKANQAFQSPKKAEQDRFSRLTMNNQMQHFDSFKNIQNLIQQLNNKKKHQISTLNELNSRGDQLFSCSQSDNEDLQINRKSFSIINRKHASIKKRMTERTTLPEFPESDKRIIVVSEECRQRMLLEIGNQISKKRKQAGDIKLRANIIKKIEEKYQQFFDNI